MAKGKRKRKVVKTRACASGVAYASGKNKGKCVPTKPGKGCWAKSKKQAAEQLKLYSARKASALAARTAKQAKRGFEWMDKHPVPQLLEGLRRRRRRRRGRR